MNKFQPRIFKFLLSSLLYLGWMQANAQVSFVSGTVERGYSLNTGAVYVDPNLQISSLSPINGCRVTISSGFQPGDILTFTEPLPVGVTYNWNANNGVLSFLGSVPAEDWQNLLRSVTFRNNNDWELGDRRITFSAGSLSAFSNGHVYELVNNGGTDWNSAKIDADNSTYLGMAGYLATITSQEENNFISQVLATDAWIGASDDYNLINNATGSNTYSNQSTAEGNWYWVTGPEAGSRFSFGNNYPLVDQGWYANWNSSEPDNAGGENYGTISSSGSYGRWSDLPVWSDLPYIIEYGGMPGDPSISIAATTRIFINVTNNTAASTQTICFNTTPVALNGSMPGGGNGNYAFQWLCSTTGVGGSYVTAPGLSTGINYAPGNLNQTSWYCRVVSSGSAVDTSAAVEVSVNPSISFSSSSIPVTCFGGNNGIAVVSVSNGAAPYSYAWTGGGTTATVSGLSAGTYTCTITDANACTASRSITITQPTALTASASSVDTRCHDGNDGQASVTPIGGTAPYTFSWSNGAATQTTSGLQAGNYSVTITDNKGCTTTRQAIVSEPDAIQTALSATATNCFGSSNGEAHALISGGTPPYSLSWSNGSVAAAMANIPAGSYTLTVTDANGCTASGGVNVNTPSEILGTVSTTALRCAGDGSGEASVLASGGTGNLSYLWSNGSTTPSLAGLNAGNYSVIVTDANNCTRSFAVNVSEPPALNVSVQIMEADCGQSNGSASASVAGGAGPYIYEWSTGASGQFTSGLAVGNYSVSITDAAGCEQTQQFIVNNLNAPAVTAITHNPSCHAANTGTIDLRISAGSGSYNLLWDNGLTSASLNNLPAGVYGYTVSDANGCTVLGSVTLSEPSPLSINAIVNAAAGSGNGSIDLTVSGGVPGYNYQWSNGATTEDIFALLPYDYSVTVTDANGCTSSQLFTISTTTGIAVTQTENMHRVFPNPNNGYFRVQAKGDALYQLIDLTGKLVRVIDLRGMTDSMIDVDQIHKGVYLLREIHETGIRTERIIVQ